MTMNHRSISSCLLFAVLSCAAVSATGCASADNAADVPGTLSGEALPGAPASMVTVAELEVARNKVSFVAFDVGGGAPTIGIFESGAPGANSWTNQLASQGLTTLEMFLALAPEGAEPPDALVDGQAREARALGRTDTSIHRVAIDVNAPVEKSLATCWPHIASPSGSGWVSTNGWNNSDWYSSAINGTWDYLGHGNGYGSAFWEAMTTCNESTTDTMNSQFAISSDDASWQYTPFTSVAPGSWLALLYPGGHYFAAYVQSWFPFEVVSKGYTLNVH
jgi:hypothetical protein